MKNYGIYTNNSILPIHESTADSLEEVERMIPKYSPFYEELTIKDDSHYPARVVKTFHFPKDRKKPEIVNCLCGSLMKTISYKENKYIGTYKNKLTSVYIGWVCPDCGRVVFCDKKYHTR
jgi:hypothetical protein